MRPLGENIASLEAERRDYTLKRAAELIREGHDMDWFTALQFGLFAAAQGVKLAETFGDEDVPGEKKKQAAEKLALGALGVAAARGAMDDQQYVQSVDLVSEFSQLAFEAFDIAGIVNKEKKRG